jgi:hypothetical protein
MSDPRDLNSVLNREISSPCSTASSRKGEFYRIAQKSQIGHSEPAAVQGFETRSVLESGLWNALSQ